MSGIVSRREMIASLLASGAAITLFQKPGEASIYAQMSWFDNAVNDFCTVQTAPSGNAWPSGNPLFFSPGTYTINGVSYVMTNEGLYSYSAFQQSPAYSDGEHHIVFQSSTDSAVKALLPLIRFGTRDESGFVASTVFGKLKTQQASLLCGNTCALMKYALSQIGIVSRLTHVLRKDTPNNEVDGHQPLEVFVNGRWQIYEASFKRAWQDPVNGGYLSLLDLVVNTGVENAQFTELCTPTTDSMPWSGTMFNEFDWYLNNTYSKRARTAALNGLYQIPGWDWAGGTINGTYYQAGVYFLLTAETAGREVWVKSISTNYHTTYDQSLIIAMFYS